MRLTAFLYLFLFAAPGLVCAQKIHLSQPGYNQVKYYVSFNPETKVYHSKPEVTSKKGEVSGVFKICLKDFNISADTFSLRGLFNLNPQHFAREVSCTDCKEKNIGFQFDKKSQMVTFIISNTNYSFALSRQDRSKWAPAKLEIKEWTVTDSSYWFSVEPSNIRYGTFADGNDTSKIGVVDVNRNGVFGDPTDLLTLLPGCDSYFYNVETARSGKIKRISGIQLFNKKYRFQVLKEQTSILLEPTDYIHSDSSIVLSDHIDVLQKYMDSSSASLIPYLHRPDKIIYLNFWTEYCPPCIENIPLYNSLIREYPEKVEVIGVYSGKTYITDFNAEMLRNKFNMEFPLVMGGEKLNETFLTCWFPYGVIIWPNGKIQYRCEIEDLRTALENAQNPDTGKRY